MVMAIADLVSAARELIILVDGVFDLHRIVASQESHILPVFLALYHLIIKPLAEYRDATIYDEPSTGLLGL